MPRSPIALPRWNTLAFFGLLGILCACGDDGTGPADDAPDSAAFLVQSLTVGTRHTCALTAEGKAFCWGGNEWGQLGDGTTTDRSSPVAVAGGLAFKTLEAGGTHTCGVTTEAASYCWGANHRGQLGDGTTTDRPVPGMLAGGLELVILSLGGGYSCGLTAGGAAYCWGGNLSGNFGNGKEVVDGACELIDSGQLERIWPYCTSPVPAALGLNLRTLEPGSPHGCGLTVAGKVYCWGTNSTGLVGDNTTTDRLTPVPVVSDLRYADLSGGATYACALRSGGVADCWGALPFGYMDEHSTASESELYIPRTPAPVAPELTFESVSVGYEVACGLTDDGVAHCWGDNLYGQLGDGTTRDPITGSPRMTPRPVVGGRAFQTLVAGYRRVCGLTADGVAYCWGRNDFGQLGDGTTRDRSEPVVVRAPS